MCLFIIEKHNLFSIPFCYEQSFPPGEKFLQLAMWQHTQKIIYMYFQSHYLFK